MPISTRVKKRTSENVENNEPSEEVEDVDEAVVHNVESLLAPGFEWHERIGHTRKEIIYSVGNDYIVSLPLSEVNSFKLFNAIKEIHSEDKPYRIEVVMADFERPYTYFTLIFKDRKLKGLIYLTEIEYGLAAKLELVLAVPARELFEMALYYFNYVFERFDLHRVCFLFREDAPYALESALEFGFEPLLVIATWPNPKEILMSLERARLATFQETYDDAKNEQSYGDESVDPTNHLVSLLYN